MAFDLMANIGADPFPGLRPNSPARPEGTWREQHTHYDLLFVEFDDQGRPFETDAIERVMAHLDTLSKTDDVVAMLFVHGWKHSARKDDENVLSVQRLLHTIGHTESLRRDAERPKRVVGIYVGWRGLTLHWAGVLENATFWGRKEAALRVAVGSVRELFARLRRFRLASGPDQRNGHRLIIAGHSFGGLVVHAAVAEYLVESAVTANDDRDLIAPFGDLTILVNPAFEASRFYPLHAILARKRFAPRQVPVFISVTAENDWATGLAFPTGRHLTLYTGASATQREHDANFDTMGHVLWMQTHELKGTAEAESPDVKLIHKKKLTSEQRRSRVEAENEAYRRFMESETGPDGRLNPGWTRTYTAGAVLTQISPAPDAEAPLMSPENPFWVVRATADVVDGHNGIFGFVFLDFLRQVLDDLVRASHPSQAR